jgi:hypothetical protein
MLDDRLLAFSLKLPTDYKLKNQKLRWFFKEALKGFLPDEILTKKKQGFGRPGVASTTSPKALATDSLTVWLTRRGARFCANLLVTLRNTGTMAKWYGYCAGSNGWRPKRQDSEWQVEIAIQRLNGLRKLSDTPKISKSCQDRSSSDMPEIFASLG